MLERELRIFADAVNHPGNVKLTYQFLDPAEDSGQIGRLVNQYDVTSNRQVLIIYRDRQFILDDRDLFELFPDRSRMADFRTNWQTSFERFGAQVPPPPKTDQEAFDVLQDFISRSPGVVEQMETYLALRPKGDFQQKMTEAILRVIQDKQEKMLQRICFTQGHGEASVYPDQAASRKAHGLRRMLRRVNFVVDQIDDLQSPPDCSLLVIAGATQPFSPEEVDVIDQYIQSGGKVLALIDPANDGNLDQLFARYGITSPDNQALAYAQSAMGMGAPQIETKVGAALSNPQSWQLQHEILDGAANWARAKGRRGFIVADGVRQVQKRPDADEITDYILTELLNVPRGYTAGDDTSPVPTSIQGRLQSPYCFAVIAEKLQPAPSDAPAPKPSFANVDHAGGKLLVIGDSDFFTDKTMVLGYALTGQPTTAELFQYPQASNDDFAFIAMSYLAGIPPQVAQVASNQPTIYVSEQMTQAYKDQRKSIGLRLWVVLPGLLLLAGLGVWIARRSA